jgi:hypothetical protein
MLVAGLALPMLLVLLVLLVLLLPLVLLVLLVLLGGGFFIVRHRPLL